MSELLFHSALSDEEIERNFQNTDFFSGLMDGLNEAHSHAIGKPSQDTIARKRALPTVNVAEIRASLSMTQKCFAEVLGVSCRTVEAWESGKSTPRPRQRN